MIITYLYILISNIYIIIGDWLHIKYQNYESCWILHTANKKTVIDEKTLFSDLNKTLFPGYLFAPSDINSFSSQTMMDDLFEDSFMNQFISNNTSNSNNNNNNNNNKENSYTEYHTNSEEENEYDDQQSLLFMKNNKNMNNSNISGKQSYQKVNKSKSMQPATELPTVTVSAITTNKFNNTNTHNNNNIINNNINIINTGFDDSGSMSTMTNNITIKTNNKHNNNNNNINNENNNNNNNIPSTTIPTSIDTASSTNQVIINNQLSNENSYNDSKTEITSPTKVLLQKKKPKVHMLLSKKTQKQILSLQMLQSSESLPLIELLNDIIQTYLIDKEISSPTQLSIEELIIITESDDKNILKRKRRHNGYWSQHKDIHIINDKDNNISSNLIFSTII